MSTISLVFVLVAVTQPVVAPHGHAEGGSVAVAEELAAKHQQAIRSLGAFRVFVKADVLLDGEDDFQPMMSVEWVHVKQSDRFTLETFIGVNAANGESEVMVLDHPQYMSLSFGDQEVRRLRNWDPQGNIELPLKPGGQDASEFGSIEGQIFAVDPAAPPTNSVLFWLLFRPTITQDFSTYVRKANVGAVTVSRDNNQPVIAIDTPESLQRFTLSPSHNFLLSRVQWYDADGSPLTEVIVRDFIKTENGAWFPSDSVVKQGGTTKMRIHVEESTFSESIPLKAAIVQFPPGTRVEDNIDNVIHVWGSDGKPLHTFAEFEEYAAWEEEAARLNAPKGTKVSNLEEQFPSSMVIWINVALVVVVVFLFFLRKRLA